MNGVPVANHDDDQQQESYKQQATRLACIDRVALMFSDGIVVLISSGHENIVRRSKRSPRNLAEIELETLYLF